MFRIMYDMGSRCDHHAYLLRYAILKAWNSAADAENCAKWAKILLDAAQNAGITPQAEQELTLDDTTVRAYSEWDGQELYCDSRVKIIVPAWYQNGTVIEQGMASLL